ncbi:MAG: hypothetical protein CME70_19010 [Halobacteriovorax sp.]|nr:hypothetical protein [Halobacteriovorax sp.]
MKTYVTHVLGSKNSGGITGSWAITKVDDRENLEWGRCCSCGMPPHQERERVKEGGTSEVV